MTICKYHSERHDCNVYRNNGEDGYLTRYLCLPPNHWDNKSGKWEVRKMQFLRNPNRYEHSKVNTFPTEEAAVLAITILLETQS